MKKAWMPAAALALSLPAVAAGDADLAAIRAQITEMKQSYEARIAALESKLAEAEAAKRAAPAAAPAPAALPPAAARSAASAASGFNPEVSLILQGQYRQMKDPAGRSLTGFWPATHAHGTGTVEPTSRRGFSLDHTELVMAANIDTNWRGQAIVSMIDDKAEVEEAWFQSLGLGQGFGLKGGRFRSGIGYLNEQHPHMWDFADAPLAYQALFGAHGAYAQDGVQLKWLAPTDLFLEVGAELGRGSNFPGSERNRNGNGATALFAHVGGDVGASHAWRAGVSHLRTRTTDRTAEITDAGGDGAEAKFGGTSRTWLADFVWKWAPEGNASARNFKFQAEAFRREEDGHLRCAPETAGVGLCTETPDSYRSRQSGYYAQAVYQFMPQWRAGLRHDRLNSGTHHLGATVAGEVGTGNALFAAYRPVRTSMMVDYSSSEFSRFRLQYSQDRSMAGREDHQWTLQYIMSLGSHGAHKF